MLVHIDSVVYRTKPDGGEVGNIKKRFANHETIQDLTVEEIAHSLTAGKTVQPGVCPFSEKSREKGYRGTVKADFVQQEIFLLDMDNKRTDIPPESPASVAEKLAENNLTPAFMYETFNSTADNQRFRFAIVSEEVFTEKDERDRVQEALIAMFPQADQGCDNADRVFFGTDKGLIGEYTNFSAVCRKADLLELVEKFRPEEKPKSRNNTQTAAKRKWTKFGEEIPTGDRHGTLVSFASTVLTRYGETEQAYDLFMQRVGQCDSPKPEAEVKRIWEDGCRHYRDVIEKDPNYIPPADYILQRFFQELEPADYSDVGQAQLFLRQYGDRVRFSKATGWLVFNGTRWEESELKARELAQELTDRQLEAARYRLQKARAVLDGEAEDGGDESEHKKAEKAAKQFRNFVLKRRGSSAISATLKESEPAAVIDAKELDSDPFLLNTPGGTVDLKTGKIRPHGPSDFITKETEVSLSDDGADLWDNFLDQVTCGDGGLRDYLQRVAGIMCVGQVFVEKLFIVTGGGGNGKSSYFNALRKVLGGYADSMASEVLVTNSRKNKSPEYAELRGKRLIIAAELEEGTRLDAGVVKRVCSTDDIRAEKKFKDPFSFVPSHSTVLYTNHLPKVGSSDDGTWDRLVVIPFKARFRGQTGEILNYAEYLASHAGGAILAWCVEGAKKIIADEFHLETPECVRGAIQDYRDANDWLHNFINARCENGDTFSVGAGELYIVYRRYCEEIGEFMRHNSEFKLGMEKAGYRWNKERSGARFYGLRVAPACVTEYSGIQAI